MLIRSVELRDVDAITDIYNGYVTGGSATFETEPVGTAEMRSRGEEWPVTAMHTAGKQKRLTGIRSKRRFTFHRTILAGESASG